MAVRKPAPLLLFAFATLFAMAYFSWTSAVAVEQSRGLRSRRVLYQSADSIEPRWAPGRSHTFFSKLAAHRARGDNFGDYGPPSINPPVHDEPPLDNSKSVYDSFHQLDTSTGADIHTDYAPAMPHPPNDDHDYPPGDFIPPEKTWSTEASFMHATLPSPTIFDHPDNLSGN